jgi:hypothetical protein
MLTALFTQELNEAYTEHSAPYQSGGGGGVSTTQVIKAIFKESNPWFRMAFHDAVERLDENCKTLFQARQTASGESWLGALQSGERKLNFYDLSIEYLKNNLKLSFFGVTTEDGKKLLKDMVIPGGAATVIVGGVFTYNIVLGPEVWKLPEEDFLALLIHEGLHALLGLDNDAIADALGIPRAGAERGISDFIRNKCKQPPP